MSEAPERIWVKTRGVPKYYEFPCEDLPLLVEYVRADRIEELEAKLAKAVCLIADIEAGPSWGESLPSWVSTQMLTARTTLAELKGQDDE